MDGVSDSVAEQLARASEVWARETARSRQARSASTDSRVRALLFRGILEVFEFARNRCPWRLLGRILLGGLGLAAVLLVIAPARLPLLLAALPLVLALTAWRWRLPAASDLNRYYADTPCSTLVVCFAGMLGQLGGVPRFEFLGVCRRAGVNHALFLKDPSQSWYLRGVGGAGRSFEAIIETIRAEVDRLQPDRLVLMGYSGGGYAAVRAGVALGADAVISFVPQVFLHPSVRAALELAPAAYDPLLEVLAERCAQDGTRMRPLTRVLAEAKGVRTELHIHVGAQTPSDVREARLLQASSTACGGPAVSVHTWPGLGHVSLAGALRKQGLFEKLLSEQVTD
jgi:hypothetical protein